MGGIWSLCWTWRGSRYVASSLLTFDTFKGRFVQKTWRGRNLLCCETVHAGTHTSLIKVSNSFRSKLQLCWCCHCVTPSWRAVFFWGVQSCFCVPPTDPSTCDYILAGGWLSLNSEDCRKRFVTDLTESWLKDISAHMKLSQWVNTVGTCSLLSAVKTPAESFYNRFTYSKLSCNVWIF